jgi:hypothetical protein
METLESGIGNQVGREGDDNRIAAGMAALSKSSDLLADAKSNSMWI